MLKTTSFRRFTKTTKVIKASIAAIATLALLAGCATQPLPAGAAREDVIARYGKPTAVVALDAGTRLQYSQQPAGQSALMVDLDAAGRVVSTRQVLNPAEFDRVVAGSWTRQDVERALGRPAFVDRVASWPGDVMTYRWLDINQDMFFHVYLDAANVVQRTGQAMEIPIRINDN